MKKMKELSEIFEDMVSGEMSKFLTVLNGENGAKILFLKQDEVANYHNEKMKKPNGMTDNVNKMGEGQGHTKQDTTVDNYSFNIHDSLNGWMHLSSDDLIKNVIRPVKKDDIKDVFDAVGAVCVTASIVDKTKCDVSYIYDNLDNYVLLMITDGDTTETYIVTKRYMHVIKSLYPHVKTLTTRNDILKILMGLDNFSQKINKDYLYAISNPIPYDDIINIGQDANGRNLVCDLRDKTMHTLSDFVNEYILLTTKNHGTGYYRIDQICGFINKYSKEIFNTKVNESVRYEKL